VELADGRPVVHGVETRHLVDTHRWHLKQPSNLVHDANRSKPMLALTKVEDRHDSGLLVLRRVPLEDLGDDGFVLGVEFEGNVGVVVGGVAVLHGISMAQSIKTDTVREGRDGRTTCRVSLARRVVAERARVWEKGVAAARVAVRSEARR
jgi:hypothetical protein